MGDKLKEKMIGALAWSSVDRLGQQSVQFIIGIVLARLLSPADYGLIGMIMIFATLSYVLVESGFGAALIRKKNVTETDLNSVFFVNLAISIGLYAVLFFTAPFIANFFNQPSLIPIARVTFIAVIFNAFYIVPYIQVNKAMDFKTLAKINLFSTTISGILGITMAIMGKGVWSLVVQQTTYHFFRGIGFYFFVKWYPQFLFSLKSIRELWNFSIHILGTSLLTIVFNNLYTFLLSRFYPVNQVGYYTQANKMSETTNFTFQSILGNSTYNLFTQINTEIERLKRIYRELIQKTSLIVLPITLVLIVMAKPLFFFLFSEKWLPAVPYFQLICLANLFAPLYLLNNNLLNAMGKSKITFCIEIVKRLLIVISIVACFRYGIVSLLVGYVISCCLAFLFSTRFINKHLSHSYWDQLKDILPSLLMGLVISGGVLLYTPFIKNLYALFTIQLLSAVVLYIILLRIFFKENFFRVMSFVKKGNTKSIEEEVK